MQLFDTSSSAQLAYVTAFEMLSGAERVERAVEMAEEAKAVALAGIRYRNPGLTEGEVHAEWIGALHGSDLARAILADAV